MPTKLSSSSNITDIIITQQTASISEDLHKLFRDVEMQEFVTAVSDEEIAQAVTLTQNELNATNPVTSQTLEYFVDDSVFYSVFLELLLFNTVKSFILASYTHKGIRDTSIEDIQIEDRSTRYKEFLDLLDKEKILQKCSNIKKSKGDGIDVEEGKAESSSGSYHLNDFDFFGKSSLRFR